MIPLKNAVNSLIGQISLSVIFYIIFLIILRLLLKSLLKKLSTKQHVIFKNILQMIYNPLFLAISASMLSVIIEQFSILIGFKFPAGIAINLILIVACGWFLYNAVDAIYEIYSNKLDSTEPHAVRRQIITQLIYIRRIAHFLIILFTIAVALLNFPSVKSLALTALASAGILTAIIGFASQNTISTLIDGFQITFVHPVRVDDTIIIDDVVGVVEAITLSYVVVRSVSKKAIIIPISRFFNNSFQNLSYQTAYIIGNFLLTVNLNIDVEKVRKEFERLLGANPLWTKDLKNFQVAAQDESSMKLKCVYSGKSYNDLINLECELREQLIKFLKEQFDAPFAISLYQEKPSDIKNPSTPLNDSN